MYQPVSLSAVQWSEALDSLNQKGFALLPKVLSSELCQELINSYDAPEAYRSVINMKRHNFGLGEYKYFSYPLPAIIEQLRTELYPYLAPVANDWMRKLGISLSYPSTLHAFLKLCHEKGQHRPTPLILKYEKGGFNTLHQDLYGEVYFPFQAVLFLTEPEKDYEGGEFIMTEQRPRMQSKGIVLRPRQGQILIFTTNFRPVLGTKGYYRTAMRHGVSEVHAGKRYTVGIIFHDAQ
ncbi:2OG-Fe(II) oxygenase [Runella sp.]|uniref:2OG-Fe(II) oxygenase n=1 Tax=Runella sp. TaxID=1960881 RepID=UPI003D0A5965